MIDVAVELAIKWGDWYLGGMFAVPFAVLLFAWKLHTGGSREAAIGAAALAVVGFAVAAPQYATARSRCEELLDRSRPSAGGMVFVNGRFEYTAAGSASAQARVQYWTSNCAALLHRNA